MQYTLAQIIEFLEDDIEVNEMKKIDYAKTINAIAPLDVATNNDISFLANPHYQSQLATTQAAAVLITKSLSHLCPESTYPIIVTSPYLSYAKLTELFAYHSDKKPTNLSNFAEQDIPNVFIHSTACIGSNVTIGENVSIDAYCVIGSDSHIGSNSQIGSHVVIEQGVKIGEDCRIYPHVFIGHHCSIANRVDVHSHASIGNDGFGYAPKGKLDEQGWQKIHQLGKVIIGNNVRIGSKTCIDRGALNDTVIEDNVIIDNLVQIAHNVKIGSGTAIAACVGIAGSTSIGKRCMIGGAAGFAGHITVTDDVTITGMTMVTKSISAPGVYSSGIPVMPNNLWKKAVITFRQFAKNK